MFILFYLNILKWGVLESKTLKLELQKIIKN